MRKITVNRKDKALAKMELRHRYVPWKLLRFLAVIFDGVFQKLISADRQIFNISNKSLVWSNTEAATGYVL